MKDKKKFSLSQVEMKILSVDFDENTITFKVDKEFMKEYQFHSGKVLADMTEVTIL